MKNIGKPCAGKSHARFDEGGLVQASLLLYHNLLFFMLISQNNEIHLMHIGFDISQTGTGKAGCAEQ